MLKHKKNIEDNGLKFVSLPESAHMSDIGNERYCLRLA